MNLSDDSCKAILFVIDRIGLVGATRIFGINEGSLRKMFRGNSKVQAGIKQIAEMLPALYDAMVANQISLVLTNERGVVGDPAFVDNNREDNICRAMVRWMSGWNTRNVVLNQAFPKMATVADVLNSFKYKEQVLPKEVVKEEIVLQKCFVPLLHVDTNDWGHDLVALSKLRVTQPHAVHLLDAKDSQCKTPLWDLDENGSQTFEKGDLHRYVCGNQIEVRNQCAKCAKKFTVRATSKPYVRPKSLSLVFAARSG